MTSRSKLQIYQGIIQYIVDSTGYDLKNIAVLSNATIKNIRTIYLGDEIPPNFSSSEKHLVQLYQMILELNAKQGTDLRHFAKGIKHENTQHSTSC
ncbi:hypothetical protein [Legionella israelensis]|uniref:Uncharacterized protein n=1 Tax=Legionella israelensis TaxID=454 RepID=A0A0W0WK72_9GAMM|nr:hypothetical protein [Legionella israelensis]KTD32703.1 hypothetical protein Lisr_0375 [Legionella israelensis]SCY35686.1 hypothetical protein SAMN02746069_02163 [Legionella israelensis DSM 19235]STX58681.1 Uncharacterised protein [Legionella israelensis]